MDNEIRHTCKIKFNQSTRKYEIRKLNELKRIYNIEVTQTQKGKTPVLFLKCGSYLVTSFNSGCRIKCLLHFCK